jgi:hypothetical protein
LAFTYPTPGHKTDNFAPKFPISYIVIVQLHKAKDEQTRY